MTAYYNEFDSFAADWLEELIKAKVIAPGVVDRRSIVDVKPAELLEFTQCHFFAGIGVWSYALRLAGWPDDRPIWTGSCPCQPFSGAGQGGGFDDERHLWPHFHWLIQNNRPAIVIGEQVASKDGLHWLDLVQADLEGTAYTSGAVDTCSAGVGAPHQRQRLYWMAYNDDRESWPRGRIDGAAGERFWAEFGGCCDFGDMVYTERSGLEGLRGHGDIIDQSRWIGTQQDRPVAETGSLDGMEHNSGDGQLERRAESSERSLVIGRSIGGMADSQCTSIGRGELHRSREGCKEERARSSIEPFRRSVDSSFETAGPLNGFWRNADWLFCRDERWRAVESGTFPLADGIAGRVGKLRGYGNAINAYQAKVFIETVDEILDELA